MPSVFPWLNLPAPSTHGVSNDELPTHIQLGDHRLTLQPTGNWSLDNHNTTQYTNHIAQLNARIADLQVNGASSSINKSAYELEKHALELEKYNIELLTENERLRFQNKLLLAMCAISEGDYKKLCDEANWTKNSGNNNNNNTANTVPVQPVAPAPQQQHTKSLNDTIDTTVLSSSGHQYDPATKPAAQGQQRIPYNGNTVIAG